MKVKFILPALTEATSPFWRPIKYSLFPPLGLATLAAYLDPGRRGELVDEHVEPLAPTTSPISSSSRSTSRTRIARTRIADHYRAKGCFVALGGLHVTSLPDEAAPHADAIFLGPGEHTFPAFLADLARRRVRKPRYVSTARRTLEGIPPIRRDLIQRERYLVPNSIVVTRGCPHHCDFCYKDAFFEGGRRLLHAAGRRRAGRDRAAARPAPLFPRRSPARQPPLRRGAVRRDARHGPALPGRRDGRFDPARRPDRARGRSRPAQPVRRLRDASTPANLRASNKRQNLGRDYQAVARRLSDLGIMINGSFVFGMDDDGPDVFDRTVDWAVEQRHHHRDLPHPDALSRHRASISEHGAPQGGSPAATGTSTTPATSSIARRG